jgi:hypothetical protein
MVFNNTLQGETRGSYLYVCERQLLVTCNQCASRYSYLHIGVYHSTIRWLEERSVGILSVQQPRERNGELGVFNWNESLGFMETFHYERSKPVVEQNNIRS